LKIYYEQSGMLPMTYSETEYTQHYITFNNVYNSKTSHKTESFFIRAWHSEQWPSQSAAAVSPSCSRLH